MGGVSKSDREDKYEVEQKLIEAVKERPHIYKKTDEGHRDILKIANSWKKISELIGPNKYANCAKECEKLWKTLWAQYLAHKNKIHGKTGKEGGKRAYFRHEQSMREFDDNAHEEDTFSNVNEVDLTDMSETPEMSETIGTHDDDDPSDKTVTTPPATDTTPKQSPSTSASAASSSNRAHTNKRKRSSTIREFEEEMIDLLKSPKALDEYELFGANVVVKIRKLAAIDPKLSADLQFTIYDLLFTAEKGLLHKEN